MSKKTRLDAGKKVAARRAKACGWKDDFEDLPVATQRAFGTTGNIRISRRGDRKGFGKSKRGYGHFSGYSCRNGTRLDLVERADRLADCDEVVDSTLSR